MTGKSLFRSLRRRCDTVIVWAMVPVALLSGQSVAGCVSPSGRFAPDCHCAAMQETEAGSCTTASAATGHGACCHGNCCCCQGKSGCCQKAAKSESRPKGDGFQNGG